MAEALRTALIGHRDRLWWVAAVASGVLLAAAVTAQPWVAVGGVLGSAVLLLILTRPLWVLGGILAIGAVDLSLMTGGRRALQFLGGGLDMNGIRLAVVVAGFLVLALVRREMMADALRPHGRWFVAFLAFAAAAVLYSPSPVEGVRLLLKLAYPFVTFLAVLTFAPRRLDVDRLADWILAAAAVLVLVVNPIHVLLGGYDVSIDGRIRLSGLGLASVIFAWYMLAMLLLALARYATRRQLRYLVLAAVFAIWIVLTVTRTALPAVALGLGGMAFLTAVLHRDYRMLGLVAGVGALVLAAMLPAALERSLGFVPGPGELWALMSDPRAFAQGLTWQGRERIWPLILPQIAASPLIGHGLGASAVFMQTHFPHWDVVHNEYLRIGMDMGLIGGGLLVVALAAWFLTAVRVARLGDPAGRGYALAASGALLALLPIAFSSNPVDYYSQYMQYVAFLCAAALVAGGEAGERGEDRA
jgi:O-antigen ligase